MLVTPVNTTSYSASNNTKLNNQLAFKGFNAPLTVDEFRITGNLLNHQLEKVMPDSAVRETGEVALIDSLKELLLRASKIKLTDARDLALQFQLQRKAQNLEPKPSMTNNSSFLYF